MILNTNYLFTVLPSYKKFSKHFLVPVAFTIGIGLAESVFAYVDVTKGMIIHIIILTIAMSAPLYLGKIDSQVAQAFALVSLLRIVSFMVPLQKVYIHYQLLVIYSLLFISAMVFVHHWDVSLKDIGIKKQGFLVGIFLGIPLGLFLGYAIYTLVGPIKLLPSFLTASLSMFFLLGMTEEIIFRGILQRNIENINPFLAIITSAITFGFVYSIWVNPILSLYATFVGVIFGVIYYKTKSLIAPITAHTILNFVLFQIIPYKVML